MVENLKSIKRTQVFPSIHKDKSKNKFNSMTSEYGSKTFIKQHKTPQKERIATFSSGTLYMVYYLDIAKVSINKSVMQRRITNNKPNSKNHRF
jgi:hypothetical protein